MLSSGDVSARMYTPADFAASGIAGYSRSGARVSIDQRLAVDGDADDVLLRHQLLGERARLVAVDAHLVRMRVDERANLVHVALGAAAALCG